MRKLDSAKELLRSSTPVLFTADGVNTTHNRLMGMVRLNRWTLATISVLEYNPSPTATSRATSAASCPRRWRAAPAEYNAKKLVAVFRYGVQLQKESDETL